MDKWSENKKLQVKQLPQVITQGHSTSLAIMQSQTIVWGSHYAQDKVMPILNVLAKVKMKVSFSYP